MYTLNKSYINTKKITFTVQECWIVVTLLCLFFPLGQACASHILLIQKTTARGKGHKEYLQLSEMCF